MSCHFCKADATHSFETVFPVVHGPDVMAFCKWHLTLYYLGIGMRGA